MSTRSDSLTPKLFTVLKGYTMAQFGKDVISDLISMMPWPAHRKYCLSDPSKKGALSAPFLPQVVHHTHGDITVHHSREIRAFCRVLMIYSVYPQAASAAL